MKIASLNDIAVEGVSHDPSIKKQVMLRYGELPALTTFAQAVFEPGQATTAHAHADMYEVFFVVSGSGVIRVNDKQFALQVGSCVVAEPGEQHQLINTGLQQLLVLYFGVETKKASS